MALRHISGWVDITGPEGPIDPGYGRPGGGWGPADPGYGRPGWSPADPGYGRPEGGRPGNDLPWGPGRPGNGLPGEGLHPWLPGHKPPGFPIIPVDPDWGVEAPDGGPGGIGDWVPVDPGFGRPPIWGWLPVDPGFGVGGTPHPDNSLPGHWVPVDGDYGKPVGPCGGERPPHVWGKPLWVYIFEIGPDFGKPPGVAEPK